MCIRSRLFLVLTGLALLGPGMLDNAWAQAGRQKPAGRKQPSRPAGPRRQAPAPQRPFPPLSRQQEEYLNQVLDYWTQHSKKIKTFHCKFTRRYYNPSQIKDPNVPWTKSRGVIKYARPDKGMFHEEKVWQYTQPKTSNGAVDPQAKPVYLTQPNLFGDHWISDGKSIFQFNYNEKQLIQRELPKHLQGKAIINGPLPFLFGVERAQLQNRYWMRITTPKDAKGQYWIEAWPKNQQDAANYQRISVILDEKMFLPEYMELYYPGGEERTLYHFTYRKVNDISEDLRKLFNQSFYAPKTPFKWKKVVHRAEQPGPNRRTIAPPRIGRKR